MSSTCIFIPCYAREATIGYILGGGYSFKMIDDCGRKENGQRLLPITSIVDVHMIDSSSSDMTVVIVCDPTGRSISPDIDILTMKVP